jgi:hypothetical protein
MSTLYDYVKSVLLGGDYGQAGTFIACLVGGYGVVLFFRGVVESFRPRYEPQAFRAWRKNGKK